MIGKCETGMAVPTVLATIFILSLLGGALWQYNVAEAMQVARTEQRMQAQYLARSGADAVATHLLDNPAIISSLAGKTSDVINDSGGQVEVEVDWGGGDSVVINAVAIVGSVEQSISLHLMPITAGDVFDHGIFSVQDLDLSLAGGMGEVIGDVGSNGSVVIGHNTYHDGDTFENADKTFQRAIFPESLETDPINGTSINAGNNTVTISGSYEYDSIQTGPNGVIEFDTRDGLGGSDNIHVLVWGEINIKGGFEVIGDGTVFMYLCDDGEIKTSDHSSHDPSQLFMFMADNTELEITTGQRQFTGYIYGPDAAVYLSSNAIVHGAIVGSVFFGQSRAELHWVEPDDVSEFGQIVSGYHRSHWSRN